VLFLYFYYIGVLSSYSFVYFLENCKAIAIDANSTLGILVVNDSVHGKCKNFNTIEGIKQCSGTCLSSTSLDSGNNAWN